MISRARVRWTFLFILLVTVVAVYLNLPPLTFHLQWRDWQWQPHFGGNKLNWQACWGSTCFRIERDLSLRQGLDLKGGLQVILQAQMEQIPPADRLEAIKAARLAIERRVNLFGISEANVYYLRQGDDYRLVVELPGLKNMSEALQLIGQTAQLEVRELDPQAPEDQPRYRPTDLTGKDLKRASVVFDPQTGKPQVAIEFTPAGAKKSKEITERNLGKTIGFFLDNQPVSLATVQSVIEDKGIISSPSFTLAQAKRLAIQLNAGALPVPIKVLGQKQIGATLGAATVQRGLQAGLVGLAMVFLFMWFYYGWLGFLAGIGLLIYGLLTLAIYRLLPVTLTFAGIIGFLLSIGMAVDANILIFERLKEELRLRRQSGRQALENAFGRAWDSIRDANVCTLITCFVLFNPFEWSFLNISGMVRGFALTLALGIGIGLFTGIIVTRTLIRLFYRFN